jgi:hypothetical protein
MSRELLEAAAKAAGMRVTEHGAPGWAFIRGGSMKEGWWAPELDDGDALRLATKLDIRMTPGGADSPYAVAEWWVRPNLTTADFERVVVEGDRRAALRRAITRAAAQIGGGK